MDKVSRETLYERYIIRGDPMHKIAKDLKISVGSVHNYCKKYGIPTRDQKETFNFKGRKHTEAVKLNSSRVHKGKKVSEESKKKQSASMKKGGIGHKKKRHDGYIAIYFPDHPKSTDGGYIMEHILVMEALIGRHLEQNECVHHKNGIKHDNRKENLVLMTNSEHMSLHAKERWESKRRNDLSTR